MIDDIKINRINDKFYQINVKDNDKLKMLNVTLKNCYIPFGVEEYNKKYYYRIFRLYAKPSNPRSKTTSLSNCFSRSFFKDKKRF